MRAIKRVLESSLGSLEWTLTRGPEDALRLAREKAAKGSQLVIAIGGDGTINSVVNGLMEARSRFRGNHVLGIVPNGASCSLAKELGIPRGMASLKVIAGGSARTIDLIHLKWITAQGERKERFALTTANFGFGGAVVKLVGERIKRLGGFLAFGLGATLELLRYRATRMLVRADGEDIVESRVLCTIVANCCWEGGGMCVAPQARPDDGILDIIVVEDMPRLRAGLRHFPKVYAGRHINLPMVKHATARRAIIRSEGVMPFEFDGEFADCRECSVEVVPKALAVLVPKKSASAEP